MCGIAAFAGKDPAAPFLFSALKKLDYRGYDSWGIAASDGHLTHIAKDIGKVEDNYADAVAGTYGIGHTRWATHGAVNIKNTHPILGGKTCFVVHNGIIENYKELRKELESHGYKFVSETDTEVIAHLIDYHSQLNINTAVDVVSVVRHTLKGEYAFAAISNRFPGVVLLLSMGLPLLVAKKDINVYVASDAQAFVGYADKYGTIPHGHAALLQDGDLKVYDRSYWPVQVELNDPVPSANDSELGSFSHYMLKEIHEQPALLREWLPVGKCLDPQARPDQIVLFGCGSSYHAALLGRQYFEYLSGIPTHVEYATELATKTIYDTPRTKFIALTQSGETKDTLVAMRRLAYRDGTSISNACDGTVITNNEASAAAKIWPALTLQCGVERGVAATKTFTMQVARLVTLALSYVDYATDLHTLLHESLPDAMDRLLGQSTSLPRHIARYNNVLYLARGLLYPIAKEGALKMKEVAYVHAEAMHSSEMKHGPIALIDKNTLSIVLCTNQDQNHVTRVLSNIHEIKARKGKVFAIVDKDTLDVVGELADKVWMIPSVNPYLQPILANVALQRLSYEVAAIKGLDIDKPRNLAKSVTVE